MSTARVCQLLSPTDSLPLFSSSQRKLGVGVLAQDVFVHCCGGHKASEVALIPT